MACPSAVEHHREEQEPDGDFVIDEKHPSMFKEGYSRSGDGDETVNLLSIVEGLNFELCNF